jgi:hypothetical protein
MAVNRSLQQVLDDAQQIIHTWQENPDFVLGDVPLTALSELITQIRADEAEIEKDRTRLKGRIEDRDAKVQALSDFNVRARSGFKAVYGADSKQYKQAGGTPTSERKAPRRVSKAK